MLMLSSVSRGMLVSDGEVREQRREHLHLVVEQLRVGEQVAAGEGDRHRGDAEHHPLGGRGHGARVHDVLAHVVAVVHAAEHEVGALRHQRLDGEHHAIGGRAVHLEAPLAALHRAHGMVQRERMARGALLAVGGDDGDVAEARRGLRERVEPVGEDAVVVRAEEAHQRPAAGAVAPDGAHDARRVAHGAEVARRAVHAWAPAPRRCGSRRARRRSGTRSRTRSGRRRARDRLEARDRRPAR